MNQQNEELVTTIMKFAESGWDVIDGPAKAWLSATGNLIEAVKQADASCGSCGCEFDPLYKKVLEMLG